MLHFAMFLDNTTLSEVDPPVEDQPPPPPVEPTRTDSGVSTSTGQDNAARFLAGVRGNKSW